MLALINFYGDFVRFRKPKIKIYKIVYFQEKESTGFIWFDHLDQHQFDLLMKYFYMMQ